MVDLFEYMMMHGLTTPKFIDVLIFYCIFLLDFFHAGIKISIYQLTRNMKSNTTNVQSVVPNLTFQQLALLLCRGLTL